MEQPAAEKQTEVSYVESSRIRKPDSRSSAPPVDLSKMTNFKVQERAVGFFCLACKSAKLHFQADAVIFCKWSYLSTLGGLWQMGDMASNVHSARCIRPEHDAKWFAVSCAIDGKASNRHLPCLP